MYYPLFQDDRWDDVTIFIAGLCVASYLWLLVRHAKHYVEPLIQRSLARIPGVLPVFAVMAHLKWVHPTSNVSLCVEWPLTSTKRAKLMAAAARLDGAADKAIANAAVVHDVA